MSTCFRSIPWGSLNAAVISIVGCLAFSILFDGAMEGFSMQVSITTPIHVTTLPFTDVTNRPLTIVQGYQEFFIKRNCFQVNTLFPLGSFTFRWVIVCVTIFIITISILFLLIGAASTSKFVSASVKLNKKPESIENQSLLSRIVTSRCLLGLVTLSTMALVLIWALIVCTCAAFYIVFIGAVYSFCALVDQQCFDFTVLLPALVNRLSKQKVDLTFCKDKKEALCAKEHNQVWTFVGAFLCALMALAGLVYFLMCMTANYTRSG
ncbi:unnamed protein product [Anisakis simplex]|uniref:Uncharacterized protein n=1 Tax=Anisakis simplex TaxID=6269 RepID=A0A0M3KGT1_ANISI|nr:unnamed protein product [Anisakis simplex]